MVRLDRCRPSWRRSRAWMLGGVAIATAVSGCSSESTEAAPATTWATTTSVTATRPRAVPSSTGTSAPPATEASGTTIDPRDAAFTPEEREVIAAYRAAVEAILAAGQPPESNPDHPDLARTMVEPQLGVAREAAEQDRERGLAFRFPEESRREIVAKTVSIDGAQAEMTACSVDDGVTFEVATGEAVNADVLVNQVRAQLVLVDGRWMLQIRDLIEQRVDQEGSCGD